AERFLGSNHCPPGMTVSSGCRSQFLSWHRALTKCFRQETLCILSGAGGLIRPFDRHQFACAAFQDLAPFYALGVEIVARHGSAKQLVLESTCVRPKVGLSTHQPPRSLDVCRFDGGQDYPGHRAESDATGHTVKRLSATCILG